ncbi:MAG: helix-turn-helix domain-containing protein [Parasphingopyxis sp.]|uniref:helix-turn-helix domain-containing protein n=1 Tax=Parasphingopyxis sp. TaxID=1920299 RepID=UPI003FA0324A
MPWSGQFAFGEAIAAYVGLPDSNDLHAHAAYQLVIGHGNDICLTDESGTVHRGLAFIIRPSVPHAIDSDGPLTIVYFDPQASQALDLADHLGTDDFVCVDPTVLQLAHSQSPTELVSALEGLARAQCPMLDQRLLKALDRLRAEPGEVTIAQAARLAGLSESRLRTLTREQFGVPLSSWLIWRKLETAAQTLARGEGLAEAAYAGGFSDQAHFSRAMRRMLGITPSAAAKSLGSRS